MKSSHWVSVQTLLFLLSKEQKETWQPQKWWRLRWLWSSSKSVFYNRGKTTTRQRVETLFRLILKEKRRFSVSQNALGDECKTMSHSFKMCQWSEIRSVQLIPELFYSELYFYFKNLFPDIFCSLEFRFKHWHIQSKNFEVMLQWIMCDSSGQSTPTLGLSLFNVPHFDFIRCNNLQSEGQTSPRTPPLSCLHTESVSC